MKIVEGIETVDVDIQYDGVGGDFAGFCQLGGEGFIKREAVRQPGHGVDDHVLLEALVEFGPLVVVDCVEGKADGDQQCAVAQHEHGHAECIAAMDRRDDNILYGHMD